MDKVVLARELLETFGTVNKKEAIEKFNLMLKGEELFIVMLSEMGGISTPSKFVEDSEFTPARLSAIIKNLENKGYINKKQDELDRRCTIIEITNEGIDYSSHIREEMIKTALTVIERLGETDAAEFIRLTKKLVAIVAE